MMSCAHYVATQGYSTRPGYLAYFIRLQIDLIFLYFDRSLAERTRARLCICQSTVRARFGIKLFIKEPMHVRSERHHQIRQTHAHTHTLNTDLHLYTRIDIYLNEWSAFHFIIRNWPFAIINDEGSLICC